MSDRSACCEEPDPIRCRPTASSLSTGRVVACWADEHGHPGEDVLEHGDSMLERALELHPELRQRTAGDDHDALVRARLDERAGADQRVHRCRAEGLHVGPARLGEPARLGDRLRERASAALVAIPDGLLPAADRVLDLVLLDACGVEKESKGMHTACLTTQVLQEDARLQRLVVRMRRGERADDFAAVVEGKLAGRLVRLRTEPDELELVELRQQLVVLPLGHELAEAPVTCAGPTVSSPPRAGPVPELLGPQIADEGLVRRIRERVLVGPQRADELGQPLALARRLRAVANEVGHVLEHERSGEEPGPAGQISGSRAGTHSGGTQRAG